MGRAESDAPSSGWLERSGPRGDADPSREAGAPRVLIADDYGDALEMYALSMRRLGLRVSSAARHDEALARARDWKPDVIVVDLSGSDAAGVALTRALQADPETWNVPVIVLTHAPLPELRAEARAAGASAVLGKPCLPIALGAEVLRVLAVAARRARAPVVAGRYRSP